MSSFGEKVVQKLGKCIPDSDTQTFKALSIKCLKEGGTSGLQKLKDELKTLPALPSQDIIKEIEDIYNDYTINTLSFVFQNKQAAAMAGILTKMADKVYLDEALPSELKKKVMEDTRKVIAKLEACSKAVIGEEMMTEVLHHTEEVKTVTEASAPVHEVIADLVETIKELAAAVAEESSESIHNTE